MAGLHNSGVISGGALDDPVVNGLCPHHLNLHPAVGVCEFFHLGGHGAATLVHQLLLDRGRRLGIQLQALQVGIDKGHHLGLQVHQFGQFQPTGCRGAAALNIGDNQ